ncbi:MAG: hypothetical protein WBO19_20450, partial [Terriglobia bacterium]
LIMHATDRRKHSLGVIMVLAESSRCARGGWKPNENLYAATRPYGASVLSQRFADKPFALPVTLPQPHQGRKNVAHGAADYPLSPVS